MEDRESPSSILYFRSSNIRIRVFFSNLLTDLDLSAHVLVAITVVRVDSRLREREAEALAFAIQRRVKSAALPFLRDCGNRMKDLVFIQPRDRRPCLHLYSPRLVLKEFNRDIGGSRRFELLRHHHAQPSLSWPGQHHHNPRVPVPACSPKPLP